MDTIDTLFDRTISEIERLINTKTVIGEPIVVDGNTLIPLVNVGFGMGAGQGTDSKNGSLCSGGTGGGGGVKPVALVIINEDGVRVESVKSGGASVMEKIAETVGKVVTAKGEQADS